MRVVIALMLVGLGTGAIAQTPKVETRCAPGADRASSNTPLTARKLGDLPPANQIATVYRLDDRGCPRPVVLRRGVGTNPDRQVAPTGAGRIHPVR